MYTFLAGLLNEKYPQKQLRMTKISRLTKSFFKAQRYIFFSLVSNSFSVVHCYYELKQIFIIVRQFSLLFKKIE